MLKRVWIVSELYYPEESSTGYLLTRIAESLAFHLPVSVLCAQPTYVARGQRGPVTEVHNNVRIHRCLATTLNKDVLLFRLVNLASISIAVFLAALRRIARDDCVIVVTNPPLLPFVIAAACRLRRARCLLLVHDVYPEVLVAAGLLRPGGLAARLGARLSRVLYTSVERIVVLGRDMAELVARKVPHCKDKIVLIPNWADIDEVVPASREENLLLKQLGLAGKWVLQYAGNLGRTHGLEDLLEAARRLDGTSDVHFLFVGSGAKRRYVEQAVAAHRLGNVTILGNRPRDSQQVFLNACDAAIISFMPGMSGISVPSRMYNVLAAGKPIVAVCDSDSELAFVVEEEEVGWVVPPHDPDQLVKTIRRARQEASNNPMQHRARRAAGKYTLAGAVASYRWMIEALEAERHRVPVAERAESSLEGP